jgi:diguanylate cyclase (GGDEF)-like protein
MHDLRIDDGARSVTPAAPVLPHRSREAVLSERLETLLGIARRLTSTLDSRAVCQTIVDEANRGLRADATTIRVLRDGRLEPMAWAGMSDKVAAQLPPMAMDEPWIRELAATPGPRATTDVRASGRAGYERQLGQYAFAGELAVPLVHGDRIIGVLRSVTDGPRRWSGDDVEFIAALATHASLAVHNAELFERTEDRAAQLAVVHAASARMNRARTVEAVGRAIVEETRRILDYRSAYVHVLEAGGELVPIAVEGREHEPEPLDRGALAVTVGRGFTGWVAQHGEPLLVPDAAADPRGAVPPIPLDLRDGDHSLLVVPLHTEDGTVGVITLAKPGLAQFDEDDLRLMTILADQAATGLESARLLARLETFTYELQRLVDMGSALSASLDPRQVANLIAEHISRALDVDECAISWWDRELGRVVTMGYYPPVPADDLESSFDVQSYPETVRVLVTQATVTVDTDDPRSDQAERALLRRDGNRMLAMLPLVAKGQSIGLVELISNTPVEWDGQRLTLARTMASEAAMALENARLYEEAQALAHRDPLTGFYNHRYLHERLSQEVLRAQRSRRSMSLLMLDLDNFKLVNDTFGHLFGDRVLVRVAERIRACLRVPDVAARYGGDEFAIILPDTDGDAARVVAERIVEVFRQEPLTAEDGGPLRVGVSIGVAAHPGDGRTPRQLIAAADERLYRTKRSGGLGVGGPEMVTQEPRSELDVEAPLDVRPGPVAMGLPLAEIGAV